VSVKQSPGFVISNDTCTGLKLNAKQSCTVDVALNPTGTPGPVNGQLTVTTDAEPQHCPALRHRDSLTRAPGAPCP